MYNMVVKSETSGLKITVTVERHRQEFSVYLAVEDACNDQPLQSWHQ